MVGLGSPGKIPGFPIVQFDERNVLENNERSGYKGVLRKLDFILCQIPDFEAEKCVIIYAIMGKRYSQTSSIVLYN